MDVWEAIRTKRAIRHFTDKPLPQESIERILDAGRRAQSAKNSQPWQFIAIRNRDTLQKLSKMGDWLGHVAGATLCVVILTPAEDERSAWHMFDAGQSASYMQLAALEVGVGSCLGTIYERQATQDLLGFPYSWQARLLISFGYPDPTRERQGLGNEGRHDFSEVTHWDKW